MHQLNQQEPEGREHRADGVLEVVGRPFYTIQGEGPFAGEPAVFVRLAGCNLQCPDCDTDYTTGRSMFPPVSLRNECLWALGDDRPYRPAEHPLLVITGGEPFRQRLGPFVREVCAAGFRVQIETNGSLFEEDFPWAGNVTLVVSPKVGRVHPELRPYVKHLKYVVEAGRTDDRDGLPTHVLGNRLRVEGPWPEFKGTVWVQPADMQNDVCDRQNIEEAVAAAKKFGYRVSLQTHKILGVD